MTTNKLERFTQRARRALSLAQEAAETLEHGNIGTEHLLLGLMRETDGVANRVLGDFNVTAEQIEALVKEMSQAGTRRSATTPLELSVRTRRALEMGVDEARQMGHDTVGTEHLLLGILRQNDSTAANILRKLGLDLERIRQTTRSMILLKSVPEPEKAATSYSSGREVNLKVLQMIEDDKITAAEGTELLKSMQPNAILSAAGAWPGVLFGKAESPGAAARDARSALRIHLRVTDKASGALRGEVSLPFQQTQATTTALARQVLMEGQPESAKYELEDGDQRIEVMVEHLPDHLDGDDESDVDEG